jgi:RNA polymerase sigma-70 factor (sigma-E family)
MMALVPTPTTPTADALRDLYQEHRWSLVRLASLLLHDPVDAEEVVQDAFVQAHVAWVRLRDPEKALPYLRSAVLNGCRSRLRHRKVVARFEPRAPSPSLSPEAATEAALPERQRECLVLRYYLDLSEAEIATTLGISTGSVKTHAHRGLATLAARLEVLL